MSYVRIPYRGVYPNVHPSAFVAPTATLIGDVTIGPEASIWFGVVLRGDVAPIVIGPRTSIQDNSVVHATGGLSATTVGADCTVGHAVTLHGCIVGDRVLVGMGSIVLDNARIEDDAILGAGSLVTPNTILKSGFLSLGRPAKPARPLSDDDRLRVAEAAQLYVGYGREYLSEK
jgi:carbonic anhydrase/acetyltransferase-like protein (isoleucine patch superfamily)